MSEGARPDRLRERDADRTTIVIPRDRLKNLRIVLQERYPDQNSADVLVQWILQRLDEEVALVPVIAVMEEESLTPLEREERGAERARRAKEERDRLRKEKEDKAKREREDRERRRDAGER